MKHVIKRVLTRLVRAGLPRDVLEVLSSVRREPAYWDDAASQLELLKSHVQRVGYPQYLYGLLCAMRTARAIGAQRFTAVEFGVAGGNGLVAMEHFADAIEEHWGVSIHVVGFDMLSGLPERIDPRDCAYAFRGGEFAMDEAKLRGRLRRAELRLGDVAETVVRFTTEEFPPVGFVSNDLDLYTSTRDSFVLLRMPPERLLPRVTLYFDDLVGYPYTTEVGEWAALREFNKTESRKIGQMYGLRYMLGRRFRFAQWPEMFFMLHDIDHPAYNAPEVAPLPNLTLRDAT